MSSYEYKVMPAPTRGVKAKGLKTTEDRFANAVQTLLNDLAAEGWEYLRADTLPAEKREGLMSKTTTYVNMLVFRRAVAAKTGDAPLFTREAPAVVAAAPAVSAAPAVKSPVANATDAPDDKKPETPPASDS